MDASGWTDAGLAAVIAVGSLLTGGVAGYVVKGATFAKTMLNYFGKKDNGFLKELGRRHGRSLSKWGRNHIPSYERFEDPAISGALAYVQGLDEGACEDDSTDA